MQRRSGITLQQKLRYLKEVDGIHALAKKVKPPQGKSWSDIADTRYRQIMRMPINIKTDDAIRVEDGGMHHQHSPRSARLIERTLKSGLVHPDVLLQYHTGKTKPHRRGELKFLPRQMPALHNERPPAREGLRHDDMRVQHVVQHMGDLQYPHGHLQGEGFIPKGHSFNSHVQVDNTSSVPLSTVPMKDGPPGEGNYH